jgi:hypothetical protein
MDLLGDPLLRVLRGSISICEICESPEATCVHKKPSAFVCVSLRLIRNCENEK